MFFSHASADKQQTSLFLQSETCKQSLFITYSLSWFMCMSLSVTVLHCCTDAIKLTLSQLSFIPYIPRHCRDIVYYSTINICLEPSLGL